MITEHLMRPGNGRVDLIENTPPSVIERIIDAVGPDGPGAHLMITTAPVLDLSDASLDSAIYAGRVDSMTDRTIGVIGLSWWLDSLIPAEITHTSAGPTTWLNSILTNGLTQGDVTGAGVTRSFPAHSGSRRQVLDAVAQLGPWDYRVNPDFSVDTSPASVGGSIFRAGAVVVTTDSGGAEPMGRTGVEAVIRRSGIVARRVATDAVVLGSGTGEALNTGSASRSRSLLAPDGTTATFVDAVNAPSAASDLDAVAAEYLANQGHPHPDVEVSSMRPGIRMLVEPGDWVWVWDQAAGISGSGPLQFMHRGDVIAPVLMRVLALQWPVESGRGVYLRVSGESEWVDLTSWIRWETGPSRWTVGDWSPAGYGTVNRSDPAVEARVTTGPMSVTDLEVSGDMSDPSGRRFVRTDTTRINPAIVQRGRTSGTTNGSGDLTITIDNPLQVSGNTVFVPTRFTGGANIRGCHVVSQPNTTQFVVRCWNASGLDTNTSVIIWWIAIGPEP